MMFLSFRGWQSAKIPWLGFIYSFKMGSHPVSALMCSYAPGFGSAVKLNMSMLQGMCHGRSTTIFPKIGGGSTLFWSIWLIMEYQQETTNPHGNSNKKDMWNGKGSRSQRSQKITSVRAAFGSAITTRTEHSSADVIRRWVWAFRHASWAEWEGWTLGVSMVILWYPP